MAADDFQMRELARMESVRVKLVNRTSFSIDNVMILRGDYYTPTLVGPNEEIEMAEYKAILVCQRHPLVVNTDGTPSESIFGIKGNSAWPDDPLDINPNDVRNQQIRILPPGLKPGIVGPSGTLIEVTPEQAEEAQLQEVGARTGRPVGRPKKVGWSGG